MDDDEARELMEDVVAEKQEDADVRRYLREHGGEMGEIEINKVLNPEQQRAEEMRRGAKESLQAQRERIRAAQGLVEKAEAMGEADLVLTFKTVSYQEWRHLSPARRWASGYPGNEDTLYYRLVDAVPMASVIGEEFKRGWNRGMAGIAPNPDSLEARVTRLEVLFGLKKEA